ncbi:MAG: HAMP domain-containing histidine kinase [Cellulomonadaceae bacterium]|nr:HAMP domain-containing histidine kinase [Cellulomonadaceae bacterium]
MMALLLAVGLATAGVVTQRIVEHHLASQLDDQLARTLSNRTALREMTGEASTPTDYVIMLRLEDSAAATVGSVSWPSTTERYGDPAFAFALADAPLGRPFTVSVRGGSEPTSWRVLAESMPVARRNNFLVPAPESEGRGGENSGRERGRGSNRQGGSGSAQDGAGQSSAGQDGIVAVALPVAGLTATTATLSRTLWITGLAIVTAGGLAAFFLVKRSLRPLRGIESTAAAIAAGDLSQRVPNAPPSTEVGSLSASLNTMLSQVETSFTAREASEQRMRRFVADASHDLRTPLAAVRGYAELYRIGAVPEAEVGATMERIEQSAQRMGTLVEELLALARFDESRPLVREPVDLTAMATEAAQDLRALDPTRTVTVAGADEPVIIQGDPDLLRQVFTNLIANVARHTPAGTPAEIVMHPGEFDVVDHGPGLPLEQRERIFERFYRTDSSRTRAGADSGGSGLGLAIVDAIVKAHHGTVSANNTPDGGLTIHVSLPT